MCEIAGISAQECVDLTIRTIKTLDVSISFNKQIENDENFVKNIVIVINHPASCGAVTHF